MTDHEYHQACADDQDGAAPKPPTYDRVFFWIAVVLIAATLAGCIWQACQPAVQ